MKILSLLGCTLVASIARVVQADSASPTTTTIECEACPAVTSTPDVVTRSSEPTTPCSAPPLGTAPAGTGGTGVTGTGLVPTDLPPAMAGAPGKGKSLYVGASGLVALAMGVVLMM
ncbi:hypothetical protein E4U43_000498 [Claviceps pusilla]|uniref:Uncharacterized protein n=1 Tax=Claviceps pusilla TaxID=123648 RepID=A0A9P7NBV3_9HYPO|nr:hypothetical protein E4U43_000498 [Claviceps pusilla]